MAYNQPAVGISRMKGVLAFYPSVIGLFLCGAALFALTVPFDPSRGLVEIDVLLDGRVRARFGIDTGADKLYIDRTFASRQGLTFADNTRRRKVTGVSGASAVAFVDLRSLAIGGEVFNDMRATAIDMHELAGGPAANMPDGLIGYDILRRFAP